MDYLYLPIIVKYVSVSNPTIKVAACKGFVVSFPSMVTTEDHNEPIKMYIFPEFDVPGVFYLFSK